MALQLAQANIARLAHPLTSPQLATFLDQLDPVNALADTAPGFVWRLQTEDGNATSLQAFSWDRGDSHGVIVNMSTWADLESLREFVFGAAHAAVMRQRRTWFQPVDEAYSVCWWVPAGHRPMTAEAEEKVRLLREQGPTADAFTLKAPFPASP